ncbi:MAG: hypothetical protein ABI823_03030 [Bryobacteraceae bacterium]
MSIGILAVIWTVRTAMAYYAVAVAAWLLRREELARWAWTAGAIFFVAHVAAAFAFVHSWSHEAAYAETARQTLAMTGFASGAGLWLNYVFTTVWVADVVWLWAAPQRYRERPRWQSAVLHGFMLFMAINGTIVFAHGVMRSASIATLGGLLLIAIFRLRGR